MSGNGNDVDPIRRFGEGEGSTQMGGLEQKESLLDGASLGDSGHCKTSGLCFIVQCHFRTVVEPVV